MMKFIFSLLFLFSLTLFQSHATHFSPLAHGLFYEVEKLKMQQVPLDRNLPEEFTFKYGLQNRNGKWYAGFLGKIESPAVISTLKALKTTKVTSVFGNIVSFFIDIEHLEQLRNVEGLIYAETGNLFSPFLKHVIPDVRADSVHQGIDLPLPFYGKDVIVAVLDWGFDYTHPNFYDTLMQNYRVVRAWDQNKPSTTPPPAFGYGKELITEQEIKNELHDIPFWDANNSSHGTHVAGIAAGGGSGIEYRGVAPVADLLLISLMQNPAGFADAVAYVDAYATEVGKPYVINMSFGGHIWPHDGKDLFNAIIDQTAGKGKIFTGSMGNNGNPAYRFHLYHDFVEESDTIKTLASFLTQVPNSVGQVLSLWAHPGESFKLSLAFPGPAGQILAETQWYSTDDMPEVIEDTLFYNNDSLAYRIIRSPSGMGQNPYMIVEMIKPIRNNITVQLTSENARLHAWNVLKLKTYIGNTGWTFSHNHGSGQAFSGYKQGDNLFGATVPSGTGENVLTVGAYSAKRFIPATGNWVDGNIANFSSFGPTTDLRTKPDITAPGRNVISAISSYQDGLNPFNYKATVEFNGNTYAFQDFSGTSMSCPVVSGVVALMLEANPDLSANQVKQIIKQTAYHDQFTDSLSETTGSNQWGWGKVNAYEAVRMAVQVVSSEDVGIPESAKPFLLYPNPAKHTFTLLGESHLEGKSEVHVFDAVGRKIISYEWMHSGTPFRTFCLPDLQLGYYLVVLQKEGVRKILPLIIKP